MSKERRLDYSRGGGVLDERGGAEGWRPKEVPDDRGECINIHHNTLVSVKCFIRKFRIKWNRSLI